MAARKVQVLGTGWWERVRGNWPVHRHERWMCVYSEKFLGSCKIPTTVIRHLSMCEGETTCLSFLTCDSFETSQVGHLCGVSSFVRHGCQCIVTG